MLKTKTIILIIMLLISATIVNASTTGFLYANKIFANNVQEKIVDVFLIGGQSNALGRGNASESPIIINEPVYQFNNSILKLANDPVGLSTNGSAWPSFGLTYYQNTGRMVVLVPTAVGASAQDVLADNGGGNWDDSGSLFDNSVNDLNETIDYLTEQNYIPIFRGVLWAQGERDGAEINDAAMTESDYKTALTNMISKYRNLYGNNMPFNIFLIGDATGEDFDEVRNAQREVSQEQTLTKIIYGGASGFNFRLLMADSVHYKQEGYNEMGVVGANSITKSNVENWYNITYVDSGFSVRDSTCDALLCTKGYDTIGGFSMENSLNRFRIYWEDDTTTSSIIFTHGDSGNDDIIIEDDGTVITSTASSNFWVGTKTGESNFHFKAPTDALMSIESDDGTAGNWGGLRFQTAGNDDNQYYKGGIFFKATTTSGRGELILAVDNTDDVSNIESYVDAGTYSGLTIKRDGNIEITNLSGAYTGGSAFVCVSNDGTLFSSEVACP